MCLHTDLQYSISIYAHKGEADGTKIHPYPFTSEDHTIQVNSQGILFHFDVILMNCVSPRQKNDRNNSDIDQVDSDGEEEVHNSDQEDENSLNLESALSTSARNTSTHSYDQFEFERSTYSTKSENISHTSQPLCYRTEKNDKLTQIWPVAATVLVLSLLIIYYIIWPTTSTSPMLYDCPQFKELTKQFGKQDKLLFKSLKAGIESVLNNRPPNPSVFLLAYSDMESAKRLMEEIVRATANCMNSNRPIELDGKSFATEEMTGDYGVIIDRYRGQLEENGIMYVADLNRVPFEAAQAFHTICDTVTPLVHRAVIFFTIKLYESESNITAKKLSEMVENELQKNWRQDDKIEVDTLKALIGRVTDQVFLLKTENWILRLHNCEIFLLLLRLSTETCVK